MSSIFLTNLEKNYQKINNYMNLIFLSIFLLISLLFFLIIYMYLKFEDKFEKVEVCIFGPDFDRKAPIRGIFEEHGFKIVRGVDDSKLLTVLNKNKIG